MALKSILVLLLFWSCNIVVGLAALITHHAGYATYDGDYYGGQARISTWGVPNMNPNSRYEATLTLSSFNGSDDGPVSFARVGLHVFPELYHDTELRLYTSWRDDNSNTGCYNTNCPGFVVANSSIIYPGQVVSPPSQYDGKDRYMAFSLRKDPTTQLWTVYREEYYNTSLKIGWWQKGILGGLEDKADAVQWISYAYYLDNNTGPSMGSGHFPREGSHKAAYMADLKHFDQAGNVYSPNIHDLARHVDRPDCYDVLPAAAFLRELSDIHKFYYGGPRGCRN